MNERLLNVDGLPTTWGCRWAGTGGPTEDAV